MADIFVTFDYELFFGSRTGTAEKCLLDPTDKLIQLAKKHQAKFTFFVDVLYLMKLKANSTVPCLRTDFENIQAQLRELINEGHDVQLHLHTHWIDASYNGEWKLDYSKYRIHNFSVEEIDRIVNSSINFLEGITRRKIFAFRAGGWCLQPFEKLHQAFLTNGIWLDSTVYYKGHNQSPTHFYDFRKAPDLDVWNFNYDPLQIETDGMFTELPISSCVVSPLFFWRLILIKKMFHQKYLVAGDGSALSKSKTELLRMVFTPTYSVVSCDGYKSSMLESAFKNALSTSRNNFVVIGHPKAMSAYSFNKLESFLSKTTKLGHRFSSIHEVFGNNKTGLSQGTSII